MKQLTNAMRQHFQGNLTTLATCWRIVRRDGIVLGFTDHDVSITIDGLKYLASSGYYRTAIANSATVAVDNLEVRGFLDNELISEQDLRNGAYDFAEVEIFAVNWADLTQGICRLRYGFFGETNVRPSGMFTIELRGLMQLFSQTVGETISPDCRADLGDRRCKVKLVPDIRRTLTKYEEGDRVIVPQETVRGSIRLPLLNTRFDYYQTTNYFETWRVTNGVVTNFPEPVQDDTVYNLRPTSRNGSITREIRRKPTGGGAWSPSLGFDVWTTDPNWSFVAFFEIIRRHGVLGTVVTVLQTATSHPGGAAADGNWRRIELDAEGLAIPDNATGVRVTLRWRPVGNAQPPLNSMRISKFTYGDNAGSFSDEFMQFSVLDPRVLQNNLYWDEISPVPLRTHPGNLNLIPPEGRPGMLTSTAWGPGLPYPRQTGSIVEGGADVVEIDSGNYILDINALIAAFLHGSMARVQLAFLNASNQVISQFIPPFVDIKPAGQWQNYDWEIPLPPLTRRIRVDLRAQVAPERQGDGTGPTVAFSRLDIVARHVDSGDRDDFVQYGGMEYECIEPGETLSTTPEFSRTLNDEIQDGSCRWRAVNPQYSFLGTVTEVTDNQTFKVSGIGAPNNWFRWGVLTFITGENRFRGIEVLDWNNTTKEFKLMLPALRPIEVGTVIRVHAGCDKTRDMSGCRKFGNILNYRGEPEVPGTDQYFRVGGTGR